MNGELKTSCALIKRYELVFNDSNLTTLKEHIELMQEGYEFYYVVDGHELWRYSIPAIADNDYSVSRSTIAHLLNNWIALHGLFFYLPNKPILLPSHYSDYSSLVVSLEEYKKSMDISKETNRRIQSEMTWLRESFEENNENYNKRVLSLRKAIIKASGLISFVNSSCFTSGVSALKRLLVNDRIGQYIDFFPEYVDFVQDSLDYKVVLEYVDLFRKERFNSLLNDINDAQSLQYILKTNELLTGNSQKKILLLVSSVNSFNRVVDNENVIKNWPNIHNNKMKPLIHPFYFITYLSNVVFNHDSKTVDISETYKNICEVVNNSSFYKDELYRLGKLMYNCNYECEGYDFDKCKFKAVRSFNEVTKTLRQFEAVEDIRIFQKLASSLQQFEELNIRMKEFEEKDVCLVPQDSVEFLENELKKIKNEEKAYEYVDLESILDKSIFIAGVIDKEFAQYTTYDNFSQKPMSSQTELLCTIPYQRYPFYLISLKEKSRNTLNDIYKMLIEGRYFSNISNNLSLNITKKYFQYSRGKNVDPYDKIMLMVLLLSTLNNESYFSKLYYMLLKFQPMNQKVQSDYKYIEICLLKIQRKFTEALTNCEEGIKRYPNDPRFYHQFAVINYDKFMSEHNPNEITLEECQLIVKYLLLALNKYQDDLMRGIVCNTIAYLYLFPLTKNLKLAEKYLNLLERYIPIDTWKDNFLPHFFDTLANYHFKMALDYLSNENIELHHKELSLSRSYNSKALEIWPTKEVYQKFKEQIEEYGCFG